MAGRKKAVKKAGKKATKKATRKAGGRSSGRAAARDAATVKAIEGTASDIHGAVGKNQKPELKPGIRRFPLQEVGAALADRHVILGPLVAPGFFFRHAGGPGKDRPPGRRVFALEADFGESPGKAGDRGRQQLVQMPVFFFSLQDLAGHPNGILRNSDLPGAVQYKGGRSSNLPSLPRLEDAFKQSRQQHFRSPVGFIYTANIRYGLGYQREKEPVETGLRVPAAHLELGFQRAFQRQTPQIFRVNLRVRIHFENDPGSRDPDHAPGQEHPVEDDLAALAERDDPERRAKSRVEKARRRAGVFKNKHSVFERLLEHGTDTALPGGSQELVVHWGTSVSNQFTHSL